MLRVMQWLTASIAALAVAATAAAQQKRISPHEDVSAVVDRARIVITYGRPSMRGRAIFGALVPFDRVWCPGADEATTLESNRPLQFGTLRVPSGPHTIWMLPTNDHWTLVISKKPSGFHTQYHPDADLGRVDLTKQRLDRPVEQLTFSIEQQAAPHTGALTMAWEQTAVTASFVVVAQ